MSIADCVGVEELTSKKIYTQHGDRKKALPEKGFLYVSFSGHLSNERSCTTFGVMSMISSFLLLVLLLFLNSMPM